MAFSMRSAKRRREMSGWRRRSKLLIPGICIVNSPPSNASPPVQPWLRFYEDKRQLPTTPAALISGTHLSISLRTSLPRACGVRSVSAGRSAPSSASRLATASSRMALSSAALIRSTIGCGVPFGKNSAVQAVVCSSGKPASVADGTEAGLPELQTTAWTALFFPKGTPQPIVERINAALDKAMRDDAVAKRLAELGADLPAETERTPQALGKLERSHG